MHILSILPFLAALITATTAIQCLSPPPPNPLDVTANWAVHWSHVNTDPSTVCIYLCNWGLYFPPGCIKVAGPVSSAADVANIGGKCWPGLVKSKYRVRIAACGDSNTIYSECGQMDLANCP
ncbi:hypothetical protein BJY04DRAFT_200353 [Aspergillus karnatakaensis]|uniref:uncharacterized protein n=1 Tax=Aspergillus karnatakaensis TaxID=1810916 RepID=UPI003CCCA557